MTCRPEQLRKLMKNAGLETLSTAAAKAGMSENTARKYVRRRGKPLERVQRNYRTRKDPFEDVWSEIEQMLQNDSAFESKVLFEWLREKYPDRFKGSQLRTLQRRVKEWRALRGPDKEVFFPQILLPGKQSQSDYTHCNELAVTIAGEPFKHMLFHFMLPYSRWETASIAFSESFETLTEGYAAAVQELGGVAPIHRTDNLAAAVPIGGRREEFQLRWKQFLSYYKVTPSSNTPRKSNENGSVEKSHDLLKRALDQRLRLRGSRNFASVAAYEEFFREVIARRNKDRKERLNEELRVLKELPRRNWKDPREFAVAVSPWSTVSILRSVYSVPSRLIGTKLRALVYSKKIELYLGMRQIQEMDRLSPGESAINYRHVISHLVRKPGAFKGYRFREELFPTLTFRKAFDSLSQNAGEKGEKEYLRILNLAAMNAEVDVELALKLLFDAGETISFEQVRLLITKRPTVPEVLVLPPDLSAYDHLLDLNLGAGN